MDNVIHQDITHIDIANNTSFTNQEKRVRYGIQVCCMQVVIKPLIINHNTTRKTQKYSSNRDNLITSMIKSNTSSV